MNRIMVRAGLIASALGMLAIGIGGGYWWGQRHADAHVEVSQPAVPAPSADPGGWDDMSDPIPF